MLKSLIMLTMFVSCFAFGAEPTMTSPTNGSTLTGSTVTFIAYANGNAVEKYSLYWRTNPNDPWIQAIYDSADLGTTTYTSKEISGLPTAGETVYVALSAKYGGVWHPSMSYSYTATTIFPTGSGTALIPHFTANTSTFGKCVYYISNITDHDIAVNVTFKDQDGNPVTSGVSYVNFMTSNTEIGAGKTGIVTVYPTTWKYGYGTIEWSNIGTDYDQVALVAQGNFDIQGSGTVLARYTIPINSGAAF